MDELVTWGTAAVALTGVAGRLLAGLAELVKGWRKLADELDDEDDATPAPAGRS
jgi:hypothetical protein